MSKLDHVEREEIRKRLDAWLLVDQHRHARHFIIDGTHFVVLCMLQDSWVFQGYGGVRAQGCADSYEGAVFHALWNMGVR